jgi:hypothetical protein
MNEQKRITIPKDMPVLNIGVDGDTVADFISARLLNCIGAYNFSHKIDGKVFGDLTAGELLKVNLTDFRAMRNVGDATFREFLKLIDRIEK